MLDHRGVLFEFSLGAPSRFPQWRTVTVAPAEWQSSASSTFPPGLAISQPSHKSHPNADEVILHCGFDSIFVVISDGELLAFLMFSFQRFLFKSFLQFLMGSIFWSWVIYIHYTFWLLILTRNMVYKYFL